MAAYGNVIGCFKHPDDLYSIEFQKVGQQQIIALYRSKVGQNETCPIKDISEKILKNRLEKKEIPYLHEGRVQWLGELKKDPQITSTIIAQISPKHNPLEEPPITLPPQPSTQKGYLQGVEQKLQEGDIEKAEHDLLFFLIKKPNLEEMQNAIRIGGKLLLHPKGKNFEILLRKILAQLTHFKNLYQEQIDLAKIAAEKSLHQADHSPVEQRLLLYTKAMYFYAKALSIAHKYDQKIQVEELSISSSKIFMKIVKDQVVTRETFKTRLEEAQRSGELESFETILNEIAFLKNYRCDDEDHKIILSLCDQAKDVILALEKSGKNTQGLEPCVGKILEWLQETYLPKQTPKAIERYKNALQNFRNTFQQKRKNLAPQQLPAFQEEIHQEFLSFMKIFLDDTFAILGPPPCNYDLRACGSLARKEFCPYSDLEWMILIEDERHIPYFKTFAEILNIQVISLGETAGTNLPVFSSLGQKNRSGFHIDSGGNPATDNLIGTPKKLAQLQKPQKGQNMSDELPTLSFHSLRKSTSLQTNDCALFENYAAEMNRIFDEDGLRQKRAIGLLRYRLRDYENRFQGDWGREPLLNIKENFLELLYHPLSDLALYFGRFETNTLELIKTLPCFTPESRSLLAEAVTLIYFIRTRLHLEYGEQKETASQIDQEDGHVPLSPDEKCLLEKTYCLILRPFYAYLIEQFKEVEQFKEENPEIKTIDLLALAFQGACQEPAQEEPFAQETLIHLGRNLLSLGRKEIKDHLPYYLELSKKNNEALRTAYLSGVKEEEPLCRYLESIPNQYGKRQIEIRKRSSLEKTIASLTTPNKEEWQGFSVKITSPELEKLCAKKGASSYLGNKVLENILTSEGDIKKGYIKETQSNVVRFHVSSYDLHFKQQPTDFKNQSPFHPGKEQGVSRLMMRLFGHGVSFSTLTSFTVYRSGKKIKEYLVLISETIHGHTLKKAPSHEELDSKRLSEIFLSIPLLLPGDGREVNTILEETQNERGEKIKQLVSIDNDVMWVKPVVDNSIFSRIPKLHCQLYTVLFSLFPGFVLDPEAITQFLLINPGPLIADWLQEMIHWNQESAVFEHFEKLPDFTYKFQFEKGTGAQILSQFYHLQTFLRSHPQKEKLPAIDLLQAIISFDQDQTTNVGNFIYSEYLKTQDPHLSSPSTKLKKITKRDSSKSISMTLSNGATFKNLPKKGDEQDPYLPEQALKEVQQFMLMHFDAFDLHQKEGRHTLKLSKGFFSKTPIEKETQEILIESLIVHTYDYLDLSYSIALTDSHLERFFDKSGLHLTYLNLRHCPEITDRGIKDIASKCPNLKELYLSHCPKLTQIHHFTQSFFGLRVLGEALSFPNLETLHLSHCNGLNAFNLNTPKLTLLKADHNPNLAQGNLEAPHCKVESKNSPKLLLEWGVASLKIQQQQFIEALSFGAKKCRANAFKNKFTNHRLRTSF